MYCENVERIIRLCDKDMMALEYATSPLKLFVDCLAHGQKSLAFITCKQADPTVYISMGRLDVASQPEASLM
jgi:hypothetical protein